MPVLQLFHLKKKKKLQIQVTYSPPFIVDYHQLSVLPTLLVLFYFSLLLSILTII